jgi:hypothetical protein
LSWSTPFSNPIELPNAGKLVALEDAARYTRSYQQDEPHWQDAVEHLINAAEREPAFAHMGMLNALHHGVERVFNTDRKETRWGKRKLKRDE